MAGYQLTQGQMNAIRDVVRAERMRFREEESTRPRQRQQQPRTVVLDESIAAPTNALTDATTGEASVLRRNSSGDLEDTESTIVVVNRFEGISLSQYTICIATWIDGEWRLTSADCGALGDWP